MKGLTLTQKEQARLQVLNGILEGQISVDEAAEVLGVSERHVWRILAEYRKEGAAALAHGNRGRRANNSIPEEARTQVVALARINRLRRPNSVVRWQSLGWSRSSRVLRRRRVG